jgi:TPR repeat protein
VVPKDVVLGESWLRRAALAGDGRAAEMVGDLYTKGGTSPPNYAEAAGWYRRAAEAGNMTAARSLSSFYMTGAGVPKDEQEAARWLRVAADVGLSTRKSIWRISCSKAPMWPASSAALVRKCGRARNCRGPN